MKKILSFLMIVIMVFGLCSFNAKANEIKKTQLNSKQIQDLKSLGFSDEDITRAPDLLEKKLGGLQGKVVSKDTKYYKFTKEYNGSTGETKENSTVVSEQEALKGAKIENEKAKNNDSPILTATYSYTQNSWLKLETWISKVSGSNQYCYKTSFTWLSEPANDIDEYISTGWSPNVSADTGSEFLFVNYTERDPVWDGGSSWHYGDPYDVTDYYWSANIKSAAGYGFNFRFNWVSSQKYGFSGTMAYLVSPTVSNIVKIDAYGDYAHKYLTVWPSVTITDSGILSLSPSIGVSNADNTHANYYF